MQLHIYYCQNWQSSYTAGNSVYSIDILMEQAWADEKYLLYTEYAYPIVLCF